MQPERMQNEGYRNWLKSSLSLCYVRQAVTGFAQGASLTLHQNLSRDVQQRLSGLAIASPIGPCTTCTSKSIRRVDRRSRGAKWQINCPVCSVWLEEMLRHHAHWPTCAYVTWNNTNPALWHTHPWEVAKVYQPRGCKNNACAEDADVACLLGFMNECVYLHQYFANPQLLQQVIVIRNSVMHSANLEVPDPDLQAWTATIVALLEDPKHLQGLPECQEAVRKIHELVDNELDLSLNKQLEAQALQQRKEVTKQDLGDLESLIRTVESEMDTKLECLKEDVETFKMEVANANEQITVRMDKLDESILECANNVEQIMKKSDGDSTAKEILEQAIDEVDQCKKEIVTEKERITDQQKFLENQSKSLEAICSRTEHQLERLTGLGQQLSTVREQESARTCMTAGVLGGSPTRITNQYIKYLQEILLAIYNQHCRRVSVCPLMPDDRQCVDKIYVEPLIKVVNPTDATRDPDSATKSLYEELFFNDDEECKNIYITGEAGFGKSAFCEKMVSIWCRVHARETTSAVLSGDERIMSEFPLLFYLSLKDAASEGSIVEMIKNQLVKEEALDNILRGTKCLVILDGLDEWQYKESRSSRFKSIGIPDRPLTTPSTIITTTRPWKLESLRLKKNEVDRHVHIVGLCESSSGALANSVIDILCKKKKRKMNYAAFEEAIEEAKLEHFLPIPLILLQLLCLWYDGKPFGNSQCEIYSNMIERQLQAAEHNKGLECSLDAVFSKVPKLPKCFKQNKVCQRYRRTLIALSKFAFDAIFSTDRNSVTVVNHSETEMQDMSKNDIEIGLLSGILTQNKVEDSCTERRKCIDFVHNTYQEFFAAIYIITLPSGPDLDQLFRVCCSVSRILEISDVFLFVFGMNSQVGSLLLQRILKVVSDDDNFQCNRRVGADQKLTSTMIVKLQKLTMNILEESERTGQKKRQLQLEDLKVDKRNLAQTGKHLHNVKTKHVKSLCMNTKQSSQKQKAEYSNIFDQISKSRSLEKLDISDTMHFIDTCCIFRVLRHSKSTLKSLRLKYVNLSNVSDKVLNIFKIDHLESITLSYVYLTHKQMTKLLTFRMKGSSSNISEVAIEGLRCVDHGPWNECKLEINLSQLKIKTLRLSELEIKSFEMDATELVTLELGYLRVPGCVCEVLSCLKDARKLEQFQCNWCKEKTDVEQLVQTLPMLTSLKRIEISRADIKDNPLRLSPMMKNMELVELRDLNVSYTELMQFVNSLPDTEHRLDVRLDELTVIEEGGMDDLVQYIRESPRFALVTSGDCINFHTDV